MTPEVPFRAGNRLPRRHANAFTLVEILIVVVILGILAAIVIPQFANASDAAQESSVLSSLRVIRSQIELYHAHHESTYPTLGQLGADWNVLTSRTDLSGNVGVVDGVHVYGPYIKKVPENHFQNSSTISDTAAAGVGWMYDEPTGRVYAVLPLDKATELGLNGSDWVRTYN